MRTSIPVDQPKLEHALQEAEANGPLTNLSALWVKAAEIYNQTTDKPISHSVVMLRAKDWNLSIKTQKGRRGRAPGQVSEQRISRGKKFSQDEQAQQSIEAMDEMLVKNEAIQYKSLVKKIGKGNVRAAVKLNCLQCCAFVPKEVEECGSVSCPLWPFRPYQEKEAA